MKSIRKSLVALFAVAGLTAFSAAVYAQSVDTPYSPSETGMALSPAEEAALDNNIGSGAVADCATPFSPLECGPSELPAVGGTAAPALGGAVNINGGSSLDRLPVTPDSDWEVNQSDD